MNLLISEPPLQILPQFALKVGLNEAILAQQIHYWLLKSDKVRDGQKWIYNTQDAWLEQFPFWSKATLKRVIASLKKQGIIITGNYNRMSMDRTTWYSINYSHAALSSVIGIHQESPKQLESQPAQPLAQNDLSISSDCTQQEVNVIPSHKLNMTSAIPETTETTTETTTDIKTDIDFQYLTASEFRELTEIRIANHKAKKAKAPVMTQRIANTLINQISLAITANYSIDDVLNEFATRGWLSIKADWLTSAPSNRNSEIVINQPKQLTEKQALRKQITANVLDVNNTDW